MADSDFLSAAGPLWGPDFIVVSAQDDAGTTYALQVFPDARNGQLKAAKLPTQYYFAPSQVYVAKLASAPADFDFGMTLFKGLLTSETTVGVSTATEAGGGFCVFSTTFAVPDSVLASVTQKLKNRDHPAPPGRLQEYFNQEPGDPDPLLGIIPISENNVAISVPDLINASAGTKVPMYISAQGTGKGSTEAHGRNSFLVTLNQVAAGAIAGSLKAGRPPFTVANTLKEQFYIEACTITVTVDVDKTYFAVSAAISSGGFLGIDSFALNAAYSSLILSGGITTDIKMDAGILTDEQKKWIETNVDDMRKKAFDLVKKDIFDWDPSAGDTPATADRGWASSLFGGSSVSLKANYQKRSIKYTDSLRLSETISVISNISGDLSDLMPAVRADLNKYLAIVDIGEFFKKMQVAGSTAVNFGEKLPDGTDVHDPLAELQLEAAYPDFDHPLASDGSPNLVTRTQGEHYTLAQPTPSATDAPALWTPEDARDIVNISWLRLDNDLPSWPANQVHLRRTLVYDGLDPRVDLSGGGLTYTTEENTADHAPILTAAGVGYVYLHFILDRIIPKSNITLTLTCTLGGRTDTLTIGKANQKNILWEVFSDKYMGIASFAYTLEVEVAGPNFADDPVVWRTPAAIIEPLPVGRIKYINPFKLTLPPAPADKIATINNYIAAYPS